MDQNPAGMIEAFDPRPGRTNKPLTTEYLLKIEPTDEQSADAIDYSKRFAATLCHLSDDATRHFREVQDAHLPALAAASAGGQIRGEGRRRFEE